MGTDQYARDQIWQLQRDLKFNHEYTTVEHKYGGSSVVRNSSIVGLMKEYPVDPGTNEVDFEKPYYKLLLEGGHVIVLSTKSGDELFLHA